MNESEQLAFREKGEKTRIMRKRELADASESVSGVTPGVTLQQILDVCTEALDATFSHDGSPDWGARLSACAVLLATFPRSLRREPELTKEIIRSVLAGTRHEALADVDPREPFRKLRKEWYEVATRVDSLGRIYIEPIPEWAIGPGETRSEIAKTERQDFQGWTVRRLKGENGRELREHVMLVKPDGTEHGIVPRADVPLEVLEAQGAFREPTDVRRL
jgi:hypothetical protein